MMEVTLINGHTRKSQQSLGMRSSLKQWPTTTLEGWRQSQCLFQGCSSCSFVLGRERERGGEGLCRLYCQKHLGLSLHTASCLTWVLEKLLFSWATVRLSGHWNQYDLLPRFVGQLSEVMYQNSGHHRHCTSQASTSFPISIICLF